VQVAVDAVDRDLAERGDPVEEPLEGLAAGRDTLDDVVLALQGAHERGGDLVVVLDDQQGGRHLRKHTVGPPQKSRSAVPVSVAGAVEHF
jgi:hypothetical protein